MEYKGLRPVVFSLFETDSTLHVPVIKYEAVGQDASTCVTDRSKLKQHSIREKHIQMFN